MIYFISDQHFGSKDIIPYYDRPFENVRQMDNELIRRYNSHVKKNDTVIFVGDFWHEDKNSFDYYANQLNGKKYFLRGNHENKSNIHPLALTINIPNTTRDENSSIYENRAFITHEPLNADLNYRINIVGHMHNKWLALKRENSWLVNVSVEMWNYYPVNFGDIKEAIRRTELWLLTSKK